ncbi:hypothetical protein C5167_044640 [Papaver somniferum]|uniref:Uncharacterized protein n=1 Tax=Papaver somniferum TaxID=3469 RepID=A0A4Y7LC19_PAPSO|nr:hypothetical protein C5167_044640 [Papaver somniferum]
MIGLQMVETLMEQGLIGKVLPAPAHPLQLCKKTNPKQQPSLFQSRVNPYARKLYPLWARVEEMATREEYRPVGFGPC